MTNSKASNTITIATWYMISNILVRGIGFISSPIFTRIMTPVEYGEFANFLSWESILVIIVSFQFQATIPRAKYDYKENIDTYISTITLFSGVLALGFSLICFAFKKEMSTLLGVEIKYLLLLCIYLFFYPAFLNLQVKHRIFDKYKLFVLLAVVSSLIRVVVAYFLVIYFDDALWGRTVGYCVPVMLINIILWAVIVYKGGRPVPSCLKYAVPLAIPMFINGFAANLLGTSDRIMINKINGSTANALYSIGYQYALLLNVVWSALNQAWTPWLFDRLHENSYEVVRDKSRWYVIVYAIFIVPTLLVAPEMVWIMGGSEYTEAVMIVPAVLVGCVFQFVYGLFINLETYEKKNWYALWGTVGAAVINIALNAILLPVMGYVVAAYTTVIGYGCLMIFHYLCVKKMKKYEGLYDLKFIISIIILIFIIHLCCLWIYSYTMIRYMVLMLYFIVFAVVFTKKKSVIKKGLTF